METIPSVCFNSQNFLLQGFFSINTYVTWKSTARIKICKMGVFVEVMSKNSTHVGKKADHSAF